MTTAVTLLYTANLGGDIWLLPRLFTLINQARREASGPVLLLDLGDSCAPESWICQVTAGRAPLIVLDSMGYDAAWIGGPNEVPMPPEALDRLRGVVMMPLITWDTEFRLTKRGLIFSLSSGQAVSANDGVFPIHVDRTTDRLPGSGDPVITLGDVPQGGLVRVDLCDGIVCSTLLTLLPEHISPDPTILAIVELVEKEARYYAGRGTS